MYHPTRGGTRGGAAEFSWEQIKNDPKREHYLGHSVNAPVGRWQNGRDVNWYNKNKGDEAKDDNSAREKRRAELEQLKRAEEETLSSVLGFKPRSNPLLQGNEEPRIGSALLEGSKARDPRENAAPYTTRSRDGGWGQRGAGESSQQAGSSNDALAAEAGLSEQDLKAARKLAKREVRDSRKEEKEARRAERHRKRDERDRRHGHRHDSRDGNDKERHRSHSREPHRSHDRDRYRDRSPDRISRHRDRVHPDDKARAALDDCDRAHPREMRGDRHEGDRRQSNREKEPFVERDRPA